MADRARWKYGSLLIEGHVSMAFDARVMRASLALIASQ